MAENTQVENASNGLAGLTQDRQKLLTYGLIGLLLVVGLYFAYKYLWVGSRQEEAIEQMYQAEFQFERDSFKLALENPGQGNKGFLAIIDEYGGTPAGSLSKYYAGVCYLQLGDFAKAIEYLESSSVGGDVLPISRFGALADAYSEKNDLGTALSYYEKAANCDDNEALTPIYLKRFALLSEKQGNKDAAIKAFERLKRDFPNTQDGRDAEKYLARLQTAK
jgi:tetratricopeptide (TPR) repeat protein